MKPSRTRKLGLALALVCAAAQLALGSSAVARAFTLGILSVDSHTHSLALHSDGNHLDLVLSHDEGHPHDHETSPSDHDHPASLSHGDHVVHVTASEASSATPRRAILDPAPVLVLRATSSVAAAPDRVPRTRREPRARTVAELRTIVLRL